jgi:chromosome segregation ATPase
MRKMTGPLILAAIALAPADGRAQTTAASDRVAHDAVAVEVRLLRQAVERLAAVTVRSHVLVSRLAVQQQRLAREQDAVERAEEAIDAGDREQERRRAALERANRVLGNVVEEPRSELRREVDNLRAELDDHDRQIARLRTRLSKAEQSLRSEQQMYRQLEAELSGLDRELERRSP